ncbi:MULTISPECIES: hypothetical protein [unclassified Streptomyces]|uniref:hypothetical protein n=1 Tax=unclassified Streptomyces TaxID=2593676 RepID=UPI00381CEF46
MQRHLVPLVVAAALLCAGCSGGSGSGSGSAREAEKPGQASPSRSAEDHGAAVRAAVAATKKSSARIDERIEIGDGTTDYVISIKGDGDTVYMGGFAEMEGSWGSIRRDGAEAHYVLRAPMNDPEHVLRQVAQMRRISKVGEETVNGASTVHYRGVLPDETVTLRMAKDMRAKIDSAREQVGGLTVYADAWIDRNGRIARTRLDWPMGTAGARATMNLADHGKPVRAKAPERGKVVPMPELGGPLPG